LWLLGATGALAAVYLAGSRIVARSQARSDPSAYHGPMNQVLLKDYDPISSLVVAEHHPAQARFPVIDIHVHSVASTPEAVIELMRAMDAAGVSTMAIMTGAVGPNFDRIAALYRPYPTRFILFCGIDTRDEDVRAADYSQRAVSELERCYRSGGRGVGEVVDKGRGLEAGTYVDAAALKPRESRLHLDDPRLDAFWLRCAELRLPVVVHVADHPSAWKPDDSHQERTPAFQVYNQYGLDVPSHAELISRFLKVVERNPKTTFISAHVGNLGHDFAQLGRALDAHPNLNIDLSARDYELGRQPFTAPAFFAAHADRILYGSDLLYDGRRNVAVNAWRSAWRLLETRDEFIKGPSWWRLYGMGLQDGVLEAVYNGNAKRVLNGTR